ncbi:MAG: prolyl oligopeptidase family serine peptidase [Spirochaetota bacterium]
MKKKLKYIILVLPFLFIATGLVLNLIIDLQTYDGFPPERFSVKYDDNDVPVIGNIFKPKNKYDKKYPVIIYFSGFMAQKDIDPRIPVEFCRRGFLVLTIDIHGHGEMDGSFGSSIITDVKNAIRYVKTNLKEIADVNRICILGHSAGGYAALGAGTSSVAAAAVWAAPSYYDEKIIYKMNRPLKLYNPSASVEYLKELNKSAPYYSLSKNNSDNLLIIHHESDPVVSIKQAESIQRKTGARLIKIGNEKRAGIFAFINAPLLNHYLIHDSVLIDTINWFETKLDLKRVKVDENYHFLYLCKFYFIIIFFTGSFLSVFSLIYILSNKKIAESVTIESDNINKSTGYKYQFLSLFSPLILFGSLFMSHQYVRSLEKIRFNEYFLVPSAILLVFMILYLVLNKINIISILDLEDIGKSLTIGLYFIIINFLFVWNFKFFVLYPHKFFYYLVSFIITFPWFFLSGQIIFQFSGNRMLEFVTGKTGINPNRFLVLGNVIPVVTGIIYYLIFLLIMPKVIAVIIVVFILLILFLYSSYMIYRRYSITGTAVTNSIIASFFYGTCYWFF